ncbi:MAG TPA: hypothetical protein VHZ53_14000 [Steroidobacteraceae bacterium]|nr:hypothetical protein [Steroidobacteraceae bacterium]
MLELASLDSRIELMLSAEAKLEADLGAGKQQIASIIEAIDLAIDREIDARSARALETARKAKRGYLDAVADLQCWTPDGLTMPVNRQVPVPREIAREIAEAGKLRNDLHESVVTLQGYAPRADHGAALRAEFRRIYIDRERPAPEVAAA